MTGNHEKIPPFLLDPAQREQVWTALVEAIESYISTIRSLPVSAEPTPESVRSLGRASRLCAPDVARGCRPLRGRWTLEHSGPHPSSSVFRSFQSDSHDDGNRGRRDRRRVQSAACGLEAQSLRHRGGAIPDARLRFEIRVRSCDHRWSDVVRRLRSKPHRSARLAHLCFPELEREGLRGLRAQPVFYVSAESHHSFHKAARLCGLGSAAVREIPVNRELRMEPAELEAAIRKDRSDGFAPFLVVGTAGTTNAGAIDPLPRIADIAANENLWFHADAAWGGAAALVSELRPLLAGIDRADSITLDAHKWLSVPMGAGILLTRHPEILGRTFHISAAYVPPKVDGTGFDAYEHSLHWSRRFIGLKIFLSLAVAGWDGYAATLRQMTEVGKQLRRDLEAADWEVVNSTALPICCFQDRRSPAGRSAGYLEGVAREVVASGRAWISTTRLRGTIPVLRACITSYRTDTEDLRILVSELNDARLKVQSNTAKVAIPEA